MAQFKKAGVEGDSKDAQVIRMVFLGCGNITGKHSKTLKGFANVHRCYASRDVQKAKAFNNKYGGKGFFSSYEAAVSAPEVDVVFVATPPDSHLQLTIEAMKNGKHVIVEKPPFLHASDFDTIDQLRQQYGTQLLVAENYFYKPLRQKLEKIVSEGLIGDIKFMLFNATKTQTVADWRVDKKIAGGGALFEGGIHWVNFISNIGLTIASATGFQPSGSRSGIKMERSMQVVARYKEGAVGTLLYSWEVNALLKGLRLSKIYGTEGSITFESNGLFVFVRGRKWKLVFPGLRNIGGVKPMFEDFFQALRRGEEAAFSFALAKRDVQLLEEAYRTNNHTVI